MIESFLKYLQFEKRLSSNTVIAYQSDLEQFQTFLQKNFPNVSIESTDFGLIRSWIIQLVEEKIGPSSVNRKIACLRSFYKYLLKQEIIAKDPTTKIKILNAPKRLPSFIKENEIADVFVQDANETISEFAAMRNLLIMELFYGTGIRLSELINLRENQIDVRGRTLKVLGKRNKERLVPFTARLGKLISDYIVIRNRHVENRSTGLLLLTESGETTYPQLIYRVVRKKLASTSADKKSPHVLRHTYATHLLDKGAEINAVKDLLGHTSLAATQVYTHNSMEKLKKAFDQAHPKA